jgi:hypothetical protein
MSEVTSFRATGGAKELVETCINDLRMLSKNVRYKDQPEEDHLKGRRVAVIVLYATGQVGVTEGWSLHGEDFKDARLLEYKVD